MTHCYAHAALVLAVLVTAASAGHAQAPYPDRAITMIVPFPPGGVADTVARPVAEALSRELKQPIVVENNAGAGGKPLDFGIDDVGAIAVDTTVTRQGHAGRGNVTTDPGFVNASAGDYRSQAFAASGAFAPGGLDPRR